MSAPADPSPGAGWVYADNNATTALAPEALAAMDPFLRGSYFNPSSMYRPAADVAVAIRAARAQIAALLGAEDPRTILLTSCATESNNAAIHGAARARPERRHIVTSAVEHPAVLEVCREMERSGYEVSWLPVDSAGRIAMADYVRALRNDTLLVTLMHANNESGVIFPIAEYARIAKETNPDILFHTDATQTAGKIPLDLSGELRHVDFLSLSGHKLHGPKGVGALYLRRGAAWRPWMLGGHQENGRRAGTENVPGIIGLGAACELAARTLPEEARIAAWRDRLERELSARIPWITVNGAGADRLPNTLNLSCHFIEGESILYQLDEARICASSGSACTSGSLEPSHVLRAMQVPFTAIHGSVRFSFSRYSTEADVERIIAVFPDIVTRLRRLSPYWDSASHAPRPHALEMAAARKA
ncbi:MAG: aminotransferase class V-fold PLP-dependent enzyme [Kiritimatiellae bacterium]|nr:aminotransferase class V-fold PLP-dependent enzyme [Kiritimatiellia bacterium]